MNAAELNKAIDSVNGSAAKLQSEYQRVGLLCLERLALPKVQDIGPVNRLFMGMPKGTRKLAMGQWLLTFGAIKLNTNKDTKDVAVFMFAKDKVTDVAAATQSPWYDFAPERKLDDVFDLQVAFKALLHRAQGKKLYIGGSLHEEQAKSALKSMAAALDIPYDGAAPAIKAAHPAKGVVKSAVKSAEVKPEAQPETSKVGETA